ncbi:hypothetical protein AB670_00959 [Chryseobacterium sp. MOF25P]|jgi:hypothetical protein|uniref:hypothetical protein n=1 Tax=unclassified Chryseobacterium TaxID=2593645 RepID=UPI0008053549|nr:MULTISPECIES: hypothetical protein [unclassified Chryseobacterium]OBW42654.1 hypothetical protein AB670_00959 [Chryseobacterium sp. MOF25P]OBW47714.1 hypothetical protein AB671_00083 [Chryseobacterium sp. BGARF1]
MKEFTIVRGLFDTRKRQLTIDEYFLKFENKDHNEDLFTIISKNEIIGIRYGIHFIKGLEFYIGREYQIFIKTKSGKELKIFFKLFYRRKLNEKHQLFFDIVNELWNQYFDEILNNYIQQFSNSEEFNLCGVVFKDTCIQFDKKEISYHDLAIKKYSHYFMIYSEENQYKNKMLYYLKDNNAVILIELLNIIIKNGQFRTEKIPDRSL